MGENKLQVALTVRPPTRSLRGSRFAELARYAMCVAVTPKHALARAKNVTLEQVARETLIGYSRKDYPEYHPMLEKMFAQVGRRARIVGEHDSVTSLIAAVESGHGFALVPECLACMVGGRLKVIPVAARHPRCWWGPSGGMNRFPVWPGHYVATTHPEGTGPDKTPFWRINPKTRAEKRGHDSEMVVLEK